MADAQTPDTGSERAAVDVAVGLVLAVVSIVCLAWFIPAHVGTSASEYDVSPAFFPNLAAWLVLFLSLALVATRITRIDRSAGPLGGVSAGWPIVTQTVTWSVVALLAWYGMEAIGYMPTAAAILVLGAVACRYRNLFAIVGLAIVMPVAIDQLAWLVFQVDLP